MSVKVGGALGCSAPLLIFLIVSCSVPTEDPVPVVLPSGKRPTSVIGYTDKISYSPGEKMSVHINSSEIEEHGLYTLYDVAGKEADYAMAPLSIQGTTTLEPWKDGYGFAVSFEYLVPAKLKSGLYFWEGKIPVIIKSSGSKPITIVYPSNTINAYTKTQDRSFYTPNYTYQISFHRPQSIDGGYVLDFYKWIIDQPYDYRCIADYDLDNLSELSGSGILILPGHSEYWTRAARTNFDKFVNNGGHAIVLSGNTMWWQVRYEDDALICYRYYDQDPVEDKSLVTYLWNTPSFEFPIISSIGADFDNGGYGLKVDAGWDGYKIASPTSPLLEGLNMQKGQILSLPTGEYDGVPLKGFDQQGYPIVDNDVLGFEKIELIGFDLGFRVNQTVGTFFVFKKNSDSGIVINAGSIGWCIQSGISASDGKVKRITQNMIEKLMGNKQVFSN